MSIPIKNIYFLLCYAWDKLDEKERVNISIDDKTELVDLFAKILINASNLLLKRGIDKDYISKKEEILGVKGKIEFSQTLKQNLLFKQKTICLFDDFSSNIITNQILVSTIYNLIRTKGIDKSLQKELIKLEKKFYGIDIIKINYSHFKQVKLNRNNRFYGFIIDVCRLIYDCSLPSEEKGRFEFSDFTRDERKMNQLFEAFVRNFYKIEQNEFKVKREDIKWNFEANEENLQYLPKMQTDISLESLDKKIIIDAKYYKQTLAFNYNREKINSANLYQLFSYLLNQHNENAVGILLYPTINQDYNFDFKYKNHTILIRTVNLNADWKMISNRLLAILKSY